MNSKFEIGKEMVIKYVLFKKRTEYEVRKKLDFLNYNNNVINKIINYLKEAGYIDDEKYITKYLAELKNVKTWSKAQVKNDLYKRGFKGYIDEEELANYEIESIKKLYEKYKFKYDCNDKEQLQDFVKALLRKGFDNDNVKKIIVIGDYDNE